MFSLLINDSTDMRHKLVTYDTHIFLPLSEMSLILGEQLFVSCNVYTTPYLILEDMRLVKGYVFTIISIISIPINCP